MTRPGIRWRVLLLALLPAVLIATLLSIPLEDRLLISSLVLAGAALWALRMSSSITRPIDNLARAVQKIGRGNLDIRVDASVGGEIGALAQGINSMTASLKSARDNAEEKVDGAAKQLWVHRIDQALKDRHFRLFYQPIMPLGGERTDRPRHFEVLLRMVRDNGDIIPPTAFIPAAERYNLMQAIDRWVVEAAFADYRRLIDDGHATDDCVFSINLSGSSICDETFPKFLDYQFSTYQIPPHRICFEITETAAVTNLTQALNLMRQQKRIGCRFVLDDFGSGLSSFAYLKNLPVDGIKIDGIFVKDMVANSMDAAMVEAINNIGHVMGLATVAEYVEDQATLLKLRELKVDYVQGNWVRPPALLEECFNLNRISQQRRYNA